MLTGAAIEKMIAFLDGNRRDTAHFLKVFAYAKAIGEQEGLAPDMQKTLELAAIVHDIACPLCREKYGNANGKYQEAESEPLVRGFFCGEDVAPEALERICRLVCRHHTYENIDGADCQILLEADFLVNADEGAMSAEAIANMRSRLFRTRAGTHMLDVLYKI